MEIRKYIREILNQIDCSKDEKEELQEELTVHLEELTEDFVKMGYKQKDALNKAIEQFGTPDRIGAGIHHAYWTYGTEFLTLYYLKGASSFFASAFFYLVFFIKTLFTTFSFSLMNSVFLTIFLQLTIAYSSFSAYTEYYLRKYAIQRWQGIQIILDTLLYGFFLYLLYFFRITHDQSLVTFVIWIAPFSFILYQIFAFYLVKKENVLLYKRLFLFNLCPPIFAVLVIIYAFLF